LQQQDFTLLDDKHPQSILSFSASGSVGRPGDPDVQATVLVDAINTPFQGAAFQREQLETFLRRNGGELPLPVSLSVLADTPVGPTAATQNGNTLADDLNSKQFGLRTLTRSQGFYGGEDRVQVSINALQKLAFDEASQPGRKLLIWLGPGWPLLTGPNVILSPKDQDAIFHLIVGLTTELREARLTLYNVSATAINGSLGRAFYYESFLKGVSSVRNVQNGNLALQVFAAQSGGRVLNQSNDLGSSIASCLADAKVYYTLTFESAVAKHPDEYHSLAVKIDKPELTARTRTGYYAQP
jgi:VWFA-related protein